MSYCVYTDVSAQLKRLTEGFTASTVPTATEVTAYIGAVDAIIDAKIASAGVPLPVTNVTSLLVLKQISINRAAAMVCRALQMEEEEGKVRQKLFDDALVDIVAHPTILASDEQIGPRSAAALSPRTFRVADTQW